MSHQFNTVKRSTLYFIGLTALSLVLGACSKQDASSETPIATQTDSVEAVKSETATEKPNLDSILSSKAEDFQSRYQSRHPKETLEFFGIEPGMKVLEVLPGGGWYSQILAPYLGNDGLLVGADYSMELWPNFDFVNDEFLEGRKAWPAQWEADVSAWGGATAKAYTLTTIPAELDGSLDAVLFIRALHNLSRFEGKGEHLTNALASTLRVLKPGGIVGIVQHQAPEDNSDEWANGSHGYLKKSILKAQMEAAGFVFVSESSVNENALDVPGEGDIVWRLPPSFNTSQNDEELRAKYAAIGESNRMTLLFKKPE